MFGINDDDKTDDRDQPHPMHTIGNEASTSDGDTGQAHGSPFAAAYSSLASDRGQGGSTGRPASTNVPEEDLLQIKTEALKSLAPLVNHLEQSPEEKFKTTMMMIQASDNAELIREAYKAAGQIENEKTRAQALLDVINEINYFTHK